MSLGLNVFLVAFQKVEQVIFLLFVILCTVQGISGIVGCNRNVRHNGGIVIGTSILGRLGQFLVINIIILSEHIFEVTCLPNIYGFVEHHLALVINIHRGNQLGIEFSAFDYLIQVTYVLSEVFYSEFEFAVLFVDFGDLKGIFVDGMYLLSVADLQLVVPLLDIRNRTLELLVLLFYVSYNIHQFF